MRTARTFSVYRITNSANGRVYIGKSVDPKQRWYLHCYQARRGDATPMHRAIRKYGSGAFVVDVLETFTSEAECFAAERRLIAQHRSTDGVRGYNASDGGDGPSGCKPSAATRKKMSDAHKRRPHPPLSQETKDKIAATLRGRKNGPMSEAQKKQLRAKAVGRKFGQEVRDKVSAASLGRPRTEKELAVLANMRDARRSKPTTEESRQRYSDAAKRRWAAGGRAAFGL